LQKYFNPVLFSSLGRVRSLPVLSEGAPLQGLQTLPGLSSLYQIEFKIDGKVEPGHPILADSRYVSGSYFETMRISIPAGEPCRLALGASRRQIVTRFLGKGLRVTAIGCVAGIAMGFSSTRLLTGMLFGVSAADPVTYAGVIGLVVTVAAFALLIPAVRAARFQPPTVLRDQ
jgi:hypothetical protein